MNLKLKLLSLILAAASMSANARTPGTFETTCGASKFRVTVVNNGHPLDNAYLLEFVDSSGTHEIFKSENGGWFHAACLTAKDGSPLLVFQSYCGGSACLEGKYGVVNPATLKLLLKPSSKNVENHNQLSVLLGSSAPHLDDYSGAFCCDEKKFYFQSK